MADIDKTLYGLIVHADGCGYRTDFCDAQGCPYIDDSQYSENNYACDVEQLCRDAINLLKEYKALKEREKNPCDDCQEFSCDFCSYKGKYSSEADEKYMGDL